MNNLSLQPPEPLIWLQVIIYTMPVMAFLWLLFMWANHEDYKKLNNIKGWSDKPMTIKQLIYGTVLSCIVATSGYLIGAYYGSISMLDSIYGNVEQELDIMESRIKDINTQEVKASLEEIKLKVLNKVPSKKAISDLHLQIDSLNDRLLMLSKELMEVHMELEMELSDLEDNTKSLITDMSVSMNTEVKQVKKQFGEMYDKVDSLYTDLQHITNTIDIAKDNFFGKRVFKVKK
jgi:regulator of replication initiation timing